MKHGLKKRKLGRVKNQREALLRSLSRSLIINGRIETTEARAKEVRPFIEKLITKAKTDTVANRRIVRSRLGEEKDIIDAVFERAAEYKERPGGYTRVIKLSPRQSDGSPRAIIEFV